MRNFRKYVVVSIVLIFAVLALTLGNVNALSINPTNTAGNTATNTASNTATNTARNTTGNVSLSTGNVSTNKTQTTNTINNISKDLPKTGENDIYVVTAIGVVAIAVGAFAFAKSRKYQD